MSECCPICGGDWVPYWFTYGGPMEVCEDPICSGWRWAAGAQADHPATEQHNPTLAADEGDTR